MDRLKPPTARLTGTAMEWISWGSVLGVIACLPADEIGSSPAGTVQRAYSSFHHSRIGVLSEPIRA
ncbi:uncharacterized protein BDW43DRAFT_288819 [Aspergillus alliaceus]|uniref:uncharacterized protein n=1 Tax=Petromyces alliaceus TaxID=209559 RepID=UPI0012A442F3|nr:uncharacterized protein BDW43DRAFT_288819 [Aspergillus alliaceus]KAB8229157.1 hypothetical protein BDW43DRAFT_288819 [Aspergillus alliaceus]